MKISHLFAAICCMVALSGCGETAANEPARANYLDSVFVPKTRIATLESLRVHKTVDESGFQALKTYTSQHRSLFPEKATYQSILEAAQKAQQIESGIEVVPKSVSQRTDFKVVEFYFKINVYNRSEVPVQGLRGYFEFLSEKGESVGQSPTVSIEGPIAPGDSATGLQLQYAHDKPTGNELSEARLSKFRDDLDKWVAIAKTNDPERFRFVKLNVEVGDGVSPAAYAFGKKAPAGETTGKKLALLKWASTNKEWVDNLKKPLGGYSLVVTPVLTQKWEATHGKWLIFDRIEKVKRFFVGQQKIPSENFNPASPEGDLAKKEIIDFWGWPMELRIYQGEGW